jgi:VIT1/CCC1 family predicted Fe2+/Mn2+ transporter
MDKRQPGRAIIKQVLTFQKNEITEYHIYSRLARSIKNRDNSRVLQAIADDERRHYEFWIKLSRREVKPDRWKVFKFFWIARIFGITFGIKLMERGEGRAQIAYGKIAKEIPEVEKIIEDEDSHEQELIELIQEERLNYIGSIVLGLNDALVELTGALAGLTFALQNTRLIAMTGFITGIAASFSMAASEYLSRKSEGSGVSPLKSALYTGVAYVVTVISLILPFLLISNYMVCLALTLVVALLIILLFNFYISVAKDYSFRRRFFEMAGLSLGVALLTFGIGYVIRITLGIEI